MADMGIIDGKQTTWHGLWYHAEYAGFSSSVIDVSVFRNFKGKVRLLVKKNKYYEKGKNRPNYNFCFKDADSESFEPLKVMKDESRKIRYDEKKDVYYGRDGKRLYTYEEVRTAVSEAAKAAANDHMSHNAMDFLP